MERAAAAGGRKEKKGEASDCRSHNNRYIPVYKLKYLKYI
jgi:hypothetical protein